MMTLHDFIRADMFPTDEDGYQLVPIVYGGNARIMPIEVPHEYPIVGFGPKGYLAQWDERGNMRPDMAPVYTLSEDELIDNSLVEPSPIKTETMHLAVLAAFDPEDPDEMFVMGKFRTEAEAEEVADPSVGDKIVRVVNRTYDFGAKGMFLDIEVAERPAGSAPNSYDNVGMAAGREVDF